MSALALMEQYDENPGLGQTKGSALEFSELVALVTL